MNQYKHAVPPGWSRGAPLRVYSGHGVTGGMPGIPYCAAVRLDADPSALLHWKTFKDPLEYNDWVRWWFDGVPVPVCTPGTKYSFEKATANAPVAEAPWPAGPFAPVPKKVSPFQPKPGPQEALFNKSPAFKPVPGGTFPNKTLPSPFAKPDPFGSKPNPFAKKVDPFKKG